MNETKKLTELLELERIEMNLFRGDSRDIGSAHVFGGQVLGQALSAAYQTLKDDRCVHSIHAYFILPGDMEKPILYQVERTRNGNSFSTRRVTAIQNGTAVFVLAASFQKKEEGMEHYDAMPDIKGPDGLMSMGDMRKMFAQFAPARLKRFLEPEWPIEVRIVDPINPLDIKKQDPIKYVWFRAIDKLPADQSIHKCVLAYASDFNLLTTAMMPHGIYFNTPGLRIASLDHAMWFHRDFDANEWLLYELTSPNASNARGLCFGKIYQQDGTLVATVAQEGLIRLKKKEA